MECNVAVGDGTSITSSSATAATAVLVGQQDVKTNEVLVKAETDFGQHSSTGDTHTVFVKSEPADQHGEDSASDKVNVEEYYVNGEVKQELLDRWGEELAAPSHTASPQQSQHQDLCRTVTIKSEHFINIEDHILEDGCLLPVDSVEGEGSSPHDDTFENSAADHITTNHPSQVLNERIEVCSFITGKYLKRTTDKDGSPLTMYQCLHDGCSYQSAVKENLRQHMMTHPNASGEIYRCAQCKYKTAVKPYLQRHMSYKHPGENSEIYECPHADCGYKTANKPYLKYHTASNHPGPDTKIYKCTQCEYETPVKRHLKVHAEKHLNGNVYECPYTDCHYKARIKYYLQQHKSRKHPDPNTMYKCPHDGCKYKTPVKRYVRDHVAVQHPTSGTVYRCAHCSYTNLIKQNLKQHICKKHLEPSGKVLRCSHAKCKFKTRFQYLLKDHKDRKHPDVNSQIHRCLHSGCGYQTTVKGNFQRHMRKRH